jgi:TRAP-type C4-dicarboxylate transport system permease large subunit
MPFVYTLVVVLALLVAFPQIALFLPQALKL